IREGAVRYIDGAAGPFEEGTSHVKGRSTRSYLQRAIVQSNRPRAGTRVSALVAHRGSAGQVEDGPRGHVEDAARAHTAGAGEHQRAFRHGDRAAVDERRTDG